MWQRLLLTFALATSSQLAGQDFFPLQVGNEWVYRAMGSRSGNAALTMRVMRTQVISGFTYYLLDGHRTGSFWLRSTADGKVLMYDEATGQDKVWYDFNAPLKAEYDTAMPGCCGKAAVLDRGARYAGPIGEGDNALEIYYSGVREAGISNEKFLPYIGMVSRTQVTGGPAVAFYDLVYARIGGITVLKEKTLDFAVTLDRVSYAPESEAMVRFTLRNDTASPVELRFRDAQTYDIIVRDAAGKEIYRWSAGKGFLQVLRSELIQAERQWIAFFRAPAQPGDYTMEAFLTVLNGSYRSTLPFRVEK